MDALQENRSTPTVSESSIVLIGLLFAIVGLVFRDSFGFTSLLAALGIGLVVAGTVYIAAEGPEVVRLSLAFVSLVALPLLSYGSVVRWIGAMMVGAVVVGVSYSRISK
ncbi:hypothetical protein C475_04945 [Halosimplex carlsbadense 2-9-1]|uniref:Uncharacterized protein n=1 Tax=Halosimplex carlsbadense 2-9-1 TaxID=797114 RepID=M0D1V2_9EURY|nr:hypothetical protein [Halosimplex carlsbadense]ELZ28124.1 hypothetical protein C475_04945 [Halosimplex carlsbadense 2-9-1]